MADTNQVDRVRFTSAQVIAKMCMVVPQLALVSEEYLTTMFTTCINRINGDHWQIKGLMAQACASLFEYVARNGQRQVFDPYWYPLMQAMFTVLASPEALNAGELQGFTGSICSCIEFCNHETQKENASQLLPGFLTTVSGYIENAAGVFQNHDADQREIILNNYCSIAQPLLYAVGSSLIDDGLLGQIADLAIYAFTQAQKVTSGGLLILHGLIAAVEERIAPRVGGMMRFLLLAVKMESTDEMGCRLASGLISDIANSVMGQIAEHLQDIMPALQANLKDDSLDPHAKLGAIIAIGDVCLATGGTFTPYAQSALDSFKSASFMSLQVGGDEDDRVVLEQLRQALLDGYISILHGLRDDGGQRPAPEAAQREAEAEQFALQTFQYLEAMVGN